MHQIRNNLAPRSFQNTWTLNRNRDILLRNENDFQVPPFRINIVKRFPLCNFPIVWNELENPLIKEILNPMAFSRELKQFLLEDLPDSVRCERLFCPVCSLYIFFFFS